MRAAAGAALVIALAVVLGAALVRGEAAAWIRLGIVLVALVALLVRAVSGYRSTAGGFEGFLESVERRFPDVRSWLRNALEFEGTSPEHTSPELARAVAQETALRIERLPLATTRPRVSPQRPFGLLLGAGVAIVGFILLSPQGAFRSWQTLVDPTRAAPPVRLAVEPGSVRITPGASLAVRARVWGSPRQPRIERPGEPEVRAVAEGAGDDGARVWRFDLSQLTREQLYRVRVARTESPRYRIALAGEPAAISFDIEYRPPSYARIPAQRGTATRGDLSALKGTRARVVATFDRDLVEVAAAVPGRAATRWTALSPRRWAGEIPILADGEYELSAAAASGRSRFRYRVSALPDAPPVLSVQLPGGDLDLPAGQQIPLEVLGKDNIGLARLRLQFRKDPEAPWQPGPRPPSRWSSISAPARLPAPTSPTRPRFPAARRTTTRAITRRRW